MKFPALISVNIAIYTQTLTLTLTLPLTLPYPSAPWRPERRGTNLRRPRLSGTVFRAFRASGSPAVRGTNHGTQAPIQLPNQRDFLAWLPKCATQVCDWGTLLALLGAFLAELERKPKQGQCLALAPLTTPPARSALEPVANTARAECRQLRTGGWVCAWRCNYCARVCVLPNVQRSALQWMFTLHSAWGRRVFNLFLLRVSFSLIFHLHGRLPGHGARTTGPP